jgi:pyruvate dehydrogenase E2 component (dihydrolipoamide acetyltransferase)
VFEFKLPDLGEGVHEGEILKWHVEVGQEITEDDPLVDIETDKAAVTIPSPRGGKVVERAGGIGDTIRVGQVLVAIDDRGAGAATAARPKAVASRTDGGPAAPGTAAPAAGAATLVARAATSATPTAVPPRREGPVAAAPATRRLARELGVDLDRVSGTGPGGRVTAEDIQRAAQGGGLSVAEAEVDTTLPAAAVAGIPFLEIEPVPDFEQWGPVEREPLRSIRRKVARKMVTSMVLIPHVAHMDEADVTELEAYRARGKSDGEAAPTLLAFVAKACTVLLKAYPMFNASIDPARQEIVYKRFTNIGFAADTPRGLLVPVVKGTDRMSVTEISGAIRTLATAARDGKIELPDLQGGTFTITNVGSLGGTFVIPTINYPEAAILGMGRVRERPVIRGGNVEARMILPLTLTFDHRIADGANAARFVTALTGYLSDPVRFLAEM